MSIAEGDTFDFTIDFLGAQTLTLVNAASFWAFSYANGSPTAVTATGSIALLDANGNALALSDLKTSTEGDVHLGQFFLASDFFNGFPDPLTFYGVRYVGTVDEYASIPGQSRNYDKAGFYVNADEAIIGNAVPEPATWAMMIAGFGLCGAGLRVRAKSIVAAA